MATQQTPGAFIGGLRVVAVDGTSFDIPDSEANARVFGYPGTRPGTRAAFPKVRLVLLVEAGTHLILDALLSPYRLGERGKARKLLRSVGPGMLLMWDGGLHSYLMVHSAVARGCAYVSRVPAHVKLVVEQELPDGSYLSHLYPSQKLQKQGYLPLAVRVMSYLVTHPEKPNQPKTCRLVTNLLAPEQFSAGLLAKEYHRLWEIETTIDEVKTHLNGRQTPIRSENPREVVQELYGWLLGHWVVRCLMFTAAQASGLEPLRLSTTTVHVLRRAIPEFQRTVPEDLGLLLAGLLAEIPSAVLPEPDHRSNPRVVKKRVSKYLAKKLTSRGTQGKREPPAFPLPITA